MFSTISTAMTVIDGHVVIEQSLFLHLLHADENVCAINVKVGN